MDLNAYSAIYAIGDVHGCIDQLKLAYANILQDETANSGTKLVVLLGDYVDRGPASKAVLDFLCEPKPDAVEFVCLCGNHDFEFSRFLQNPKNPVGWLNFGGHETLRSYGIDSKHVLENAGGERALARLVKELIPEQHSLFLASLPTMLVIGRLVFVHAGIRPGILLSQQTDRDLMWIREPFLTVGPELPVLVIHGHTPNSSPVFGKSRVCIDTGAFATGRLAVLKLELGRSSIIG